MPDATLAKAPGARRYLIGLTLALILTAISFALVYFKLLAGQAMFFAIAAAAVVQVVVHLRYFLHLDLSAPPENLLSLVFAAILIFLMIGGSLWIMFDLHHRMAVQQPQQQPQHQQRH